MKDKKFYFIVLLILIIVTISIISVFKIKEILDEKNTYTIILNPLSILKCTKWDCKNVTDNISDYINNKYLTYIDGVNQGINLFNYNNRTNKIYIFDKNNKNILKSNSLLLYDGNPNFNVLEFEINELNDENILKELNDSLEMSFELNRVKYVTMDFDNDQEFENLYIINGWRDKDENFSIIVYEDSNEYYIVDKEYSINVYDVKYIDLIQIIDLYNDGKKEFIITKEQPSSGEKCPIIYRLKGKKYVAINECETTSCISCWYTYSANTD